MEGSEDVCGAINEDESAHFVDAVCGDFRTNVLEQYGQEILLSSPRLSQILGCPSPPPPPSQAMRLEVTVMVSGVIGLFMDLY